MQECSLLIAEERKKLKQEKEIYQTLFLYNLFIIDSWINVEFFFCFFFLSLAYRYLRDR
jgi:hypothetical protein